MVIVFLAEDSYVFIWTKERTIVKDITIVNDTDIKMQKLASESIRLLIEY